MDFVTRALKQHRQHRIPFVSPPPERDRFDIIQHVLQLRWARLPVRREVEALIGLVDLVTKNNRLLELKRCLELELVVGTAS